MADEATGEALGSAYVEIGAKMGEFDTAMSGAQSRFRGTVSSLEGMATGMGARLGGWLAAAASLRSFWKEAVESEETTNDLAVAITTAGLSLDSTLPKLHAFASEMASKTILDDEAIKKAMAFGMQIGVNGNAIEQTTKAAIGLAAKYNMELSAAMTNIGRLAAGGSARFFEYYGIVDKTATKSQQLAEVIRIGNEAFSIAEAKTQTLGGSTANLGKRFVDAGGSLVGFVSDMTGLKTIIQGVGAAFGDISNRIEQLRDSQFARGFGTSIAGSMQLFGTFLGELSKGDVKFEQTRQYFNNWLDYIEKGKKAAGDLSKISPSGLKKDDIDNSKMFFTSIEDAWKKQQELANKSSEVAETVTTVTKAVSPQSGSQGAPSRWNNSPGSGTRWRDVPFSLESITPILERIATNTDPRNTTPLALVR